MFNLFKKKEKPVVVEEMSLQDMLNGNPTQNEQHSGDFTKDGREIHYYNKDTQHGNHYTEEEFYAEAEKRYQNFCSYYPHLAEGTEKVNFVMNTFRDWNSYPDDERTSIFAEQYHKKVSGYTHVADESDMPDTNNWQPVHGIGLKAYAQAARLLQNNVSVEKICKALTIEKPIWDEVAITWNNRFTQTGGNDMSIFDAYMRFQTQEIENPKLKSLSDSTSDYAQQLMTDDWFMMEINAIMVSASKYGIDPMQYVLDKYQISVGDYSAASMAMGERHRGGTPKELIDYMEAKQKEYEAIFSKETGGNVADDISFKN